MGAHQGIRGRDKSLSLTWSFSRDSSSAAGLDKERWAAAFRKWNQIRTNMKPEQKVKDVLYAVKAVADAATSVEDFIDKLLAKEF